MELGIYEESDLALALALECDPAVMGELGGPRPRADVVAAHARRLAHARGGGWWFVIVPDGRSRVGTIGIWESEFEGAKIFEMGWMVVPAFQRRGFAGAAARVLLERARAERKFDAVHAFPGRENAASNAICRKSGFALLGPCAVDFADRMLDCYHWRVDLGGSRA